MRVTVAVIGKQNVRYVILSDSQMIGRYNTLIESNDDNNQSEVAKNYYNIHDV